MFLQTFHELQSRSVTALDLKMEYIQKVVADSYTRRLRLAKMSHQSTSVSTMTADLSHCIVRTADQSCHIVLSERQTSPVTLYYDDIRNLRNTSLKDLYIDGNTIDIGQPGILTYLPSSLLILSISENRWVAGIITWSPYDNLINLVSIDISKMNIHQMSQSRAARNLCCSHFMQDVSCEKSRIKNVIGDIFGSCTNTTHHYNDNIKRSNAIEFMKETDPWRCCYPLTAYGANYILIPENEIK
ncbi:unnamed protein product [Mytilus edulis]|uniref:Uncharacterized protein n=1 Tax=Mytilus edulis TaxID=6550 RepID=A0A8S3V2S2_MYTED|nr:unnamed protein product [Mytilus edulis]